MVSYDPRSNKCVFLGYDLIHNEYLLYELKTNKVYSSRDVKIFPDTYHFSGSLDKEEDMQLRLVQITQEPDLEIL